MSPPKNEIDFTQLNAPQRQAVFHGKGPLLVLAGAGSGKTKVITNRIARLILEEHIPQHKILAVTFTNKAAAEMRERLRQLTGSKLKGIVMGTFHSLGLRMIKENAKALNMAKNFAIQTSEDQMAIVSQVQKEFKIDPEQMPEKSMIWLFSKAKNSGLSLAQIPAWLDENYGIGWGTWFARYQEYLQNMNSLDFDDLLLIPRDLLQNNQEIKEQYQKRWEYILADEFQDTNPLQFNFLRNLISPPYNFCAVGDDDQAIYGWRGADKRIILDFKGNFPQARIIALEQNYRSTQLILDLANATIQMNLDRHPKKLWSAKKGDDKAHLFYATDPEAEATFVVRKIEAYIRNRMFPLNEIAILMRTNFQSRAFEEVLRKKEIPYHISGAYQFYERKEIKDILGYLRFLANEQDERSLVRIINLPQRGISDGSVKKLNDYARALNINLWDVIEEIESCPLKLSSSALSGILEFRDIIHRYRKEIHRPGNLGASLGRLMNDIALEEHYIKIGNNDEIKVKSILSNIRELLQSIYQFERPNAEESQRGLYEYLHFISIMANDNTEENLSDKVQIMTLHLAKGLEFEAVFLVGLEEGIFPHRRSIEPNDEGLEDLSALDEERRLFYVGITRAKKYLTLSSVMNRRSFGDSIPSEPSRFLAELPEHLLEISGEQETEDSPENDEEILELLGGSADF